MAKKKKKSSLKKQCSFKGCKRKRVPGETFCSKCMEENDAPNVVQKLTEMESLRFGKMDAEIRNAMQSIQILNYKIVEIKRNHEDKLIEIQNQINSSHSLVESLRPEYDKFIQDLSDSLEIEVKDLSINPDTGFVYDLRKV